MMIANFLKIGIATCLTLQMVLAGREELTYQQLSKLAQKEPFALYTIPADCEIRISSTNDIYRSPVTNKKLLESDTSHSVAEVTVSAPGYEKQAFPLMSNFTHYSEGSVQILTPSWPNRLLWWSPTLAAAVMLGGLGYLRTQKQRSRESVIDTQEALADTPASGQLVGEHYLLTEQVGAGATSEVWKAIDQRNGQTVAFKWLLEEVSAQPELVTRFQREASICQQLKHPNLIQVLDQGQTAGRFWLVQPWLNAKSLDHFKVPLEPQRVKSILLDICSGLEAAHAQGILHRDLKPANILIDADGRAIIIDFGLARSQSYPTITNVDAILGTPAYMPPEQLKGEKSRCESDCYSLGCLAFELLTGQTPFPSDDLMKLLTSHMSKTAPAPSSIVPELSKDWDDWIQNLMKKDPGSRYTASAAAQALRDQI